MESITESRSSNGTSAVATSNAEQATAWDGDEGAYWAANHRLFETSLARYQAAFIRAAAIGTDDRVLDVGCGTGISTRDTAALASRGGALGVDLSSDMIDVARQLAAQAGLTNTSFLHADAQIHPFEPASVDVVISRTGAMFFGDKHAAFSNLRRSLKPNGRLVLLTWQRADQQEWASAFAQALTGRTAPATATDGPGPFSLSNADRVRGLLEDTGFSEIELTALNEPMAYGRSVDEAHTFLLGLLGWMVADQEPTRRAASIDALRTTLAAHESTDGICFGSAAWLVTARCA